MKKRWRKLDQRSALRNTPSRIPRLATSIRHRRRHGLVLPWPCVRGDALAKERSEQPDTWRPCQQKGQVMTASREEQRNQGATESRRGGTKHTTWLVPLVALTLALTVGLGSTRRALATEPVVDHYSFNVTRPAPMLAAICGVPVMRNDVRTYTVFTYPDGSMLVVLNGANTAAFAGPGGTVTIQYAGSIKLTPNGDGTYLIEDQGNTGLNTSDGEGPIAGGAGRTVLIGTFNPATLGITTIHLISQTGILPETQLAAMCPTLRGD
jgi:hypothetical protein